MMVPITPAPPPNADDTLKLAYKEYSDEMRHFSTVRSALTTFLVTVTLGAFSAYFNKSSSHPFLVAAGIIFAMAAVVVCLTFSWRTSKAFLQRKRVWKHFTGENPIVDWEELKPPAPQIVAAMLIDAPNYFLLFGLGLILLAFSYRDSLDNFLPALPTDPAPAALLSETVLFDANKATLDTKARQTIDHVREIARKNPDSIVLLWSHADTTGSSERNKQLANLRSNAVKEMLVAGGISKSQIFSSDLGAESLPVPTSPNAPEPWNREVSIEVRGEVRGK